VRAGEARRTAAHETDALAGVCSGLEEPPALGKGVIGREALELADLDWGHVHLVVDAVADAQDLDRTHARAAHSEDVRVEDGAGRSFDVVGRDLPDELRNVDVGRARLHARRVGAKQAAIGFGDGLLLRERLLEVPKYRFRPIS
jgi:hypothetical protein